MAFIGLKYESTNTVSNNSIDPENILKTIPINIPDEEFKWKELSHIVCVMSLVLARICLFAILFLSIVLGYAVFKVKLGFGDQDVLQEFIGKVDETKKMTMLQFTEKYTPLMLALFFGSIIFFYDNWADTKLLYATSTPSNSNKIYKDLENIKNWRNVQIILFVLLAFIMLYSGPSLYTNSIFRGWMFFRGLCLFIGYLFLEEIKIAEAHIRVLVDKTLELEEIEYLKT